MLVDNVAISMIAGNCADVLPTFFKWATAHFSEINVVCQTENYDDTEQVCKDWANEHQSIKLQFHPFDNFSAQFQRSIDMCSRPWCIQLGADEILTEFPYDKIPDVIERTHKKVGILPRYNLQRDHMHFHKPGYPDYQRRIIKMDEGIGMDGNVVDETLNVEPEDCMWFNAIHIIHFGHIRPAHALKQKGIDRKKFAEHDKCDGKQLLEIGTEWFIERNKLWNEAAYPLSSIDVRWIEKFYKEC